MKWLRKLLAHFPLFRPAVSPEVRKAERARKVFERADKVLDDYRRADVVLRLVRVKSR